MNPDHIRYAESLMFKIVEGENVEFNLRSLGQLMHPGGVHLFRSPTKGGYEFAKTKAKVVYRRVR